MKHINLKLSNVTHESHMKEETNQTILKLKKR